MSGRRGNPGGRAGPDTGSAGRFYRIADIYERARREEGADDTINLSWDAGRPHEPWAPFRPDVPDLGDLWPVRRMPAWPLQPRAGHAAPHKGRIRGSLFVTLFGVPADRVAQAVARIERQIRPSQSMRPVFLTDQSDTSAFRHAGFTYEFFPPHIFGDAAQAPLFARRFETLWRKWNGVMLIDFSASGYLAERLENLEVYVNREYSGEDRFDPRLPKAPPRPAPVTDVVRLRADYMAAGLDKVPDTFVLYRILGNDLPPRHEVGQTLSNLRFMLDHEPALEACEKRWVLNRIVDPEQEAAIVALLEERGQDYLRIPFDLETYGRIGWDLHSFPDDAFFLRGRYGRMSPYDQARAQAHARRFKNNYVINNNGARNAALRDGRGRAKWVLPWDGNCFLTERAWSEIVEAVRARPYLKYFTVPMARTADNDLLLDPGYRPEPDSEPQILFRSDSTEEFDEAHYYGRRPKVELFYRLGLPGTWDRFHDDVWDLPRPDLSEDAGAAGQAGWVARLFSGQGKLETEGGLAARARGEARIAAITEMLDRLDVEAMKLTFRPERLTCYDEAAVTALADAAPGTPERKLCDRLLLEADLALQRGPYSVVHKTALPPSGERRDYYHPAPYWWPNPATPQGYPYVYRDGERVPGTRLYEPESDRYDRTRLQMMFDDTTTLALAWLATGTAAYADHAAKLLRTWFLDPETAMTPHLTYAQVRGRWPGATGAKSGLIEMKDLYYLLDAVRIVERSGAMPQEDRTALRSWLRDYLEWLQTSEQGVAERLGANNHGTCYDLQTASIAAFLGEAELLERTFLTSRERILEQFTADGMQPHEMTRTQTAHYCCFNLQCWVNLATLAQACGHDLWSFQGPDGRGLARAFGWLLPHLAMDEWPHEQIEPFDFGRFLPLFFAARDRAGDGGMPGLRSIAPSQFDPLYYPHDGVKPYWMLGRPARRTSTGDAWDEVAQGLGALERAVAERFLDATPETRLADPGDLEARLRGGFSQSALAGLRRLHAAPDTPPADRAAVSWALASWAFHTGDHAEALRLSEGLVSGPGRDAWALALLRAASLLATGALPQAEDVIRGELAKYPHDPDACLLMANLARVRSEEAAEGDEWTDWLNRMYRRAGLDGLLAGADGSLGWRWPAPPDGTEDPALSRKDGPGVTVILTPPSGAAPAAATLSSAQSQSWRKLQILIVDRSGDPAVADDLSAISASDGRVTVLACAPDLPEHEARNLALAKATGHYVTRLEAGECAHPMRIALQVAAFDGPAVRATLTRRVRMTPDGEALVGWADGPKLLQDNPASIMLETETLRASGGWDAADGDPDRLLMCRLRDAAPATGIRVVCPDLPLSLSLSAADPGLDAPQPDAAVRDAETLLRHVARTDATPAGDRSDLVAALPPPAHAGQTRLDTVFVGDFAPDAPGLDHVLALVEGAAAGAARVGVFHWPDYTANWRSRPDDRLLSLIAEGRLRWVHSGSSLGAERVVLCQTHMVAHVIDGLPDFGAARVEVMAGPQLRAPVPPHATARHLPDPEHLGRLFACPVRWVAA